MEAAAVNSTQALNIVGDSFKGSGNSASKVIKVLPWVGAVGLVLFLAYWAYCVKNNSDLSKKYESEIENKEKDDNYVLAEDNYVVQHDVYEKAESELEKLKGQLNLLENNVKQLQKKQKQVLIEMRVNENRIKNRGEEKIRLEATLNEKLESMNSGKNKNDLDLYKEIIEGAEELKKYAEYFFKQFFVNESNKIKEFILSFEKEAPNLLNYMGLKEGDALLNVLNDELIKKIEEFAKNEMRQLVQSALEELKKQNNNNLLISKDLVENYLRFGAENCYNLKKLVTAESIESIKEKVETYRRYESLSILSFSFKIIKGLVEDFSFLKGNEIKNTEKPDLNGFPDKARTFKRKLRTQGFLPDRADIVKKLNLIITDFKEDENSNEKLREFYSKVSYFERIAKRKLKDLNGEKEREEINKISEATEKDTKENEVLNKEKERIAGDIKELEEEKGKLEKKIQSIELVKDNADAKMKKNEKDRSEVEKNLKKLRGAKEELDKNFWKPYPYSYENNAQ